MRFALNISSMCPAKVQLYNRSQPFWSQIITKMLYNKAVSLGYDANTMASIDGGIAEVFYGPIPENIALEARKRLPNEFLKIIDESYEVILE